MKASSVKSVRCAIYTRVSTEHGLDQEFNSLDAQSWTRAHIYIFTCRDGSPFKVSDTTARVSPALYSSVLACLSVFVGYLIAAFAFREKRPERWQSYFDPIAITAGLDGKASLGKLQILLFSLIVFGLITYFLLKTGVLTDISSTVLVLLGIAGIGSTVAKGAVRWRFRKPSCPPVRRHTMPI
jgi:hypothetical protein